jgi:hypothetical protein
VFHSFIPIPSFIAGHIVTHPYRAVQHNVKGLEQPHNILLFSFPQAEKTGGKRASSSWIQQHINETKSSRNVSSWRGEPLPGRLSPLHPTAHTTLRMEPTDVFVARPLAIMAVHSPAKSEHSLELDPDNNH